MRLFVLSLLCAFAHGAGRVKVVLRGESFRQHSHQNSREIGIGGYYPQKTASRSHIEQLVVPLFLDMGYSGVDVQLLTHPTEWDGDLKQWYRPFLVEANGTDPWLKTNYFGEYEAVLNLRVDMILKPLFGCALARAERHKVLFSMRCWKQGDTIAGGLDRINDVLVWIPTALSSQIPDGHVQALINNHDAMAPAIQWFGKGNVSYMLPGEQHDSDPEKDFNPLYRFAARPEGQDVSSVSLNWTSLCDDAHMNPVFLKA